MNKNIILMTKIPIHGFSKTRLAQHLGNSNCKRFTLTNIESIKKVFKDIAYKIPISSTKSMIGHSLGASGSLEAIACIKSIEENIIHPTINLEDKDPECDLDYVPNNAIEKKLNVVLSNSFGFGGQNACLVIKKLHD